MKRTKDRVNLHQNAEWCFRLRPGEYGMNTCRRPVVVRRRQAEPTGGCPRFGELYTAGVGGGAALPSPNSHGHSRGADWGWGPNSWGWAERGRRKGLPWPWDRAMVCLSPLLELTVPTTTDMKQTAEPSWAGMLSSNPHPVLPRSPDKYWWSLKPGWSWMNGYSHKRQLQRSSGLASLYALPFVNDKAAQLEHLAIQSYVSCLNVASCIILYFLLREHHAWLYILSINNLYTRQGSSTVWQFYNL